LASPVSVIRAAAAATTLTDWDASGSVELLPNNATVANTYEAALVGAVTCAYVRAKLSPACWHLAFTEIVHGPPALLVTEETLADLQLWCDATTYPTPARFDDCGADQPAGTSTVTGVSDPTVAVNWNVTVLPVDPATTDDAGETATMYGGGGFADASAVGRTITRRPASAKANAPRRKSLGLPAPARPTIASILTAPLLIVNLRAPKDPVIGGMDTSEWPMRISKGAELPFDWHSAHFALTVETSYGLLPL
jgi:hypothetical protein